MSFEAGVYVITNSLQYNNAALFNDNADELVRGILPRPIGTDARDNEKVRPTAALELFSRIFSGNWYITETIGTPSGTFYFVEALAALDPRTWMAK